MANMKEIETLRQEARKKARYRGHLIANFRLDNDGYYAYCKKCGFEVRVTSDAYSGKAITDNCKTTTFAPFEGES
jgi:nitrite reductase/ring-hydroxylating ferredoxin subunit